MSAGPASRRGALAAASLLLLLGAGCLSSRAPAPTAWVVAPDAAAAPSRAPAEGASTAFGATRLGAVTVCAPYDRAAFVVRRPDGSVAFDAYNTFAAAPSALLRAPVRAQLEADGRFGRVVAPSSVAGADAAVEVLVTDLSLDCRDKGARTARAAVSVDVVRTGRGPRAVALAGDGAATADAASGDFSAAFTEAFNAALAAALQALR